MEGANNADACTQVIDFEQLNLADPMWDFAYLAVNLELEKDFSAWGHLYGASMEESQRVGAYIPLAMVHCATWTALQGGGGWTTHQEKLIERLRGEREL